MHAHDLDGGRSGQIQKHEGWLFLEHNTLKIAIKHPTQTASLGRICSVKSDQCELCGKHTDYWGPKVYTMGQKRPSSFLNEPIIMGK